MITGNIDFYFEQNDLDSLSFDRGAESALSLGVSSVLQGFYQFLTVQMLKLCVCMF